MKSLLRRKTPAPKRRLDVAGVRRALRALMPEPRERPTVEPGPRPAR